MRLRKTIYFLLLVALAASAGIAQEGTKQLDPRRYEAWTVEYEPYRLLAENAIMEYTAISGEKLEPINPEDLLIAVRSKARSGELFQIRYGTSAEGFTIIEGRKVQWVLGATLNSTIADKDKYYHLDSRIPFQEDIRKPELDYLSTELFWTNTDLLLGLDRSVYRFGSSGGLLFEWGSELLGRPYGDAGFMRVGIATPVFKIGMQVPSLLNIGIHSADEYLDGGFGGFGAFNYLNLYGELSFLTNSAGGIFKDDDKINYMDIGGLVYLNFGAPFVKLKGAFQIKPGFTFSRIAHRKILTVGDEDKLLPRVYPAGSADGKTEHYYGGFFLRLDYSSALAEELYPKFLFTLQLSGTTSVLSKIVWNLNDSISIPFTIVYYLPEGEEWTPTGFATHFGIQFRLKNPMR